MLKIKFFGQLSDISGCENIEIQNLKNSDELVLKILEDYPKFKNQKFSISINKKIISSNQSLNSGDEIAFLPPFAGG